MTVYETKKIDTYFMCNNLGAIVILTVLLFYGTDSAGQTKKSALEISHLTGDFYIFTTYGTYKGNPVPANGMYLVTNSGVVLFDTPWDTTQFQPLLDSIKIRHNKSVTTCIATHFHADKTAGLAYYTQQGIRTYSTKQTDDLCKARNEKRAAYLIYKDTTFTIGQYSFQTYYPGRGHTSDNIVIWCSKPKIMYGGCLVKSTEASDLGNLGDASVKEWAATIKNIQRKFAKPRFVIVGHQSCTSTKSLEHTLKLVQEYEKKNHLQQ